MAIPFVNTSFQSRDIQLNGDSIPKKIHYCWFGKNPLNELSEKCIESWKKYFPDYEIIRWDESNFDINFNKYVKEAYEHKKFAFVSDVARLFVMYKYGGIYFDTDIEVLSSFDSLLKAGPFLGCEQNGYCNSGLGFAALPKDPIIKEMLDDYNGISFIDNQGKIDDLPCPVRNTKILKKYGYQIMDKLQTVGNFTIYPSEYLCPKNYDNGAMNITKNTVSIHHFNASWHTKDDQKLFEVKENLIKKFGPTLGFFFFRIYRKYVYIRRKCG